MESENGGMNARVRISEGSDNTFRGLGFTESEARNLGSSPHAPAPSPSLPPWDPLWPSVASARATCRRTT